MSNELAWFVGNRNPSITQVIASNGVAVDLSSATVRFRARVIGSLSGATLFIDQPATITDAVNGKVRYDWAANDVATAQQLLVWWQVTISSKTQDVGEALVEIRDHSSGVPPTYAEVEEIKRSLSAQGTTYLDQDIEDAAQAASRLFDALTCRRYWLDKDATGVRVYTPESMRNLEIDDLVALTSLKIDRTGQGNFNEVWTQGTDFVFDPGNAPVQTPPTPWERIRVRRVSGRYLPWEYEQSVQLTGQFGWPTVPEEVRAAVGIMTVKYLRRRREAAFGIVAVGGPDTGIAMRIAATDPEVKPVIQKYTRARPWS